MKIYGIPRKIRKCVHIWIFFTCIDTSTAHIKSCDLGEMSEGRRAECLLASKMRAMRLVLVSSAAYTTVKQNPVPNLRQHEHVYEH